MWTGATLSRMSPCNHRPSFVFFWENSNGILVLIGYRYHSDDERFLGENPTIASLSLGSKRYFLMKQ